MSTDRAFASALGPTLTRFLALKRALGRRYAVEQCVLESLDAFLTTQDSDLTADTFVRWCRTREHLSSGVRRNWMRIVRNLCLYRRRTEPTCFVPDPSLFPALHQPLQPHIFAEGEIVRLLREAGKLERSPDSPLRPELFRLAITLLYTTGLRRGELLRMTTGDCDSREQTLLVRESKFHKSRLVPVSQDAAAELGRYLQARRAHRLPVSAETPLIWNRRAGGKAYTGVGFGRVFRELFEKAQIHKLNGHLPRIHDFRHTYACHALLRWYRRREDVQAKLPILAIYMGHVSIASTQYYLQFIEPLATEASERFARHCAGLITPPAAAPGGDQ
jgi:integrase/recombinase XerD